MSGGGSSGILLASAYVEIGSNVEGLLGGLDASSQALLNFSRQATVTGIGFEAAFGGLRHSLGNILNEAGELERQLNIFQAVGHQSDADMKRVYATAVELGAALDLPRVSAQDAALAMLKMREAGLSLEDTLGASRAALLLGIVGNQDFGKSAEFAAQMINAFKLPGTEFGRVVDMMSAAMLSSTMSLTEMQYGMVAASQVWNATGHSTDELIGSLKVLSLAGIEGSTAGNTLKQMLIRLMKPTNAAADTMQAYGINVWEAGGKMKSISGIIDEFNSKLGGLTDQKKLDVLGNLFGTRAINGILALMQVGGKAFDLIVENLDRAGAAQELASAQMGGFLGSLEALQSVVETVALVLGEPFLGPLREIILAFAALISYAQFIPKPIVMFVGSLLGVLAVAGPVFLTLGRLSFVFTILRTAAGGALLNVGLIAGALAALYQILREAGVLDDIGRAFEDLGKHVAPVIEMMQRFDAVDRIVRKLAAGDIEGALQDVSRWFYLFKLAISTWISEWITPTVESIRTWATTTYNNLVAAMPGIIRGINDGLATVVDIATTIYNWISGEIAKIDWVKVKDDIFNGIGTAIETAGKVVNWAIDIGTQIKDWVADKINSVDWTSVRDTIFTAIGNAITTVTTTADQGIAVGNAILNWVVGQLQLVDWEAGHKAIVDGLTAAFAAAQQAGESGAGFTAAVGNWIMDRVKKVDWNAVGTIVSTSLMGGLTLAFGSQAAGDVKASIEGAVGSIGGFFTTAFSNLTANGSDPWNIAESIGWMIGQGIARFVDIFDPGGLWDQFITKISLWARDNLTAENLGNVALGILAFPAKIIADLITGLIDGVLDQAPGTFRTKLDDFIGRDENSGLRGDVKRGIENFGTTLSNLPANILAAATDLGTQLREGFINGFTGTMQALGSVKDQIVQALKDLINSGIDAINNFLPDEIGFTVAGHFVGFTLPTNPFPRLAKGTSDFIGGLALVGERGPELVAMPRHSAVYPAGETASILGGRRRQASMPTQVVVPVSIGGEHLETIVVDLIKQQGKDVARLRRIPQPARAW